MIDALIKAARFQRIADTAQTIAKREAAQIAANMFRREAEACAENVAGRAGRVRRFLEGDDGGH
jgi:hypothetical protein